MEKAMAPHSSTLSWKIPWMEEPGRLQSMGSLRVRHNWATSLSLFTFMHWRRQWHPPLQCLAWRIPGTGEPGGLPSMGSHRVGHDWSDLAAAAGGASGKEPTCQCRRLKKHLFDPWAGEIPWRRAWQPTSVFLPGASRGRGAWWVTVHRIKKSWTWLKQLITHIPSYFFWSLGFRL